MVAIVGVLVALAAFPAAAGAAPAPRSYFGVVPSGAAAEDLDRMARLGAGSVRAPLSWRGVEPGPGRPFNWTQGDHFFREAASAGLRPMPVLLGMPGHLNRSPDPEYREPPVRTAEQRRGWRRFAAAALDRYGQGGVFWQENPDLASRLAPRDWIVWNEQNASYLWRPKASPREYATLLGDTRRAFDSIDPAARMVVGGMYGFPTAKGGMDAAPFLKRLLRRPGIRRTIDGVAVHPFAGNVKGMRGQVRRVRRVLDRAGKRRAFLVVGEVGWASGGDGRSKFVKTRRGQAKLVRKTLGVLLRKRRPWRIERVFWFTIRDYEPSGCPFCAEAGLFTREGAIKPAGRSFRRVVNRHVR